LLEANSCAIGNFDGLHLGHQDLISKSKIKGLKSLIITFENLTSKVNYLTNKNQKEAYLNELDIDYLVVFPFHIIKNTHFTDFIDILKKLNVIHLTCGKDFRFGFNREGSIVDLKNNFTVQIIEDFTLNETRISSSLIKQYISNGNIEDANKLLKNPYTIIGTVVHGNKVGRKLGYPTANIDYQGYILPKNGVYLSVVKYKNNKYIAMTNIGYNPTINEQKNTRLEVHILDFNKEIYGEEVEVSFIKYLRDEKKFTSKEELIKSLEETIYICRNSHNMLK
jgi:riboflavin kinase/FMN adenylyltransferase